MTFVGDVGTVSQILTVSHSGPICARIPHHRANACCAISPALVADRHVARLFEATRREAQVANYVPGLVNDGHAPFVTVPEPFAVLSENGSRRRHCLGVRCPHVGENSSVVIAKVLAVFDVEEVARHGAAPYELHRITYVPTSRMLLSPICARIPDNRRREKRPIRQSAE